MVSGSYAGADLNVNDVLLVGLIGGAAYLLYKTVSELNPFNQAKEITKITQDAAGKSYDALKGLGADLYGQLTAAEDRFSQFVKAGLNINPQIGQTLNAIRGGFFSSYAPGGNIAQSLQDAFLSLNADAWQYLTQNNKGLRVNPVNSYSEATIVANGAIGSVTLPTNAAPPSPYPMINQLINLNTQLNAPTAQTYTYGGAFVGSGTNGAPYSGYSQGGLFS